MKKGGASTAKRTVLDVDKEVSDDDNMKRNTIPPQDMSDEEQGNVIFISCACHIFFSCYQM